MALTSLGLMLLVAGILMLGVGLYYYMYLEGAWDLFTGGVSYPYQTQGTFGIIAGFVLLVAGIIHMAKNATVSHTAHKLTVGFVISLIAGSLFFFLMMAILATFGSSPAFASFGIIMILAAVLISMPGKEPIGSIIVITFSIIFLIIGARMWIFTVIGVIGIIGGILGLVKK